MSQLSKERRTVNPPRLRRVVPALVMLALAVPAAESQNQQNTQPPAQNPQQHPVTNAPAQQHPQTPPAQSKWHVPFFGNHNTSNTPNGGTAATPNGNANATGVKHFFNNIFHHNDSNGTNANNGSAGAGGLLGEHGPQPHGTAQHAPQTNAPQTKTPVKHNSLNAGGNSGDANPGAVNAMRPAPPDQQMRVATIGPIPG